MAETIKQKTKTLPDVGGGIVVRRMYNKPAREFLKLFAREVSARIDLFRGGGAERWVDVLLPQLPTLVQSVDELADFLVTNSTDDAEKVAKLDFIEWSQVLATALELNCGDELKNSFAGIGAALAPLLASFTTKTKLGVESMLSSSTLATAPTTSTAAPSSTSISS